ncbi:uncharacterized protein DC041_0013066 [Schistosoma bovis]|uniref:LSM domain-containing protein n=1 Tax=Schistosoma bovis TaxID=6184 RepID=A0A430QPG3_SCHBO|nr:uncharacterized protein DC041_0013066 [Schistosoma bovis]
MDSIRKEYCLTGNPSFIKTSCVTAYECNQPFVDRKWYSSQHSEQSLNLKNNGSARSSPNNSLPERKWQDEQSDSFNLPTINVPRLNSTALLPTPFTKPFKASDSPSHCYRFDPEQIHYGVHRSHSHRQQQRIFSPMASLWKAMQNQSQIMVMTRGLKEPRASIIGNLIAFDRYWNLILHLNDFLYRLNSLWYSLQTRRKHPFTEKQDNQQNEKIHIDDDHHHHDDDDDDNEQQLFIRGANIILVRIISEN